jgi:delta(3,5)-delta(2,4)-dienoyl-CoA isomerase
MANYSTKWLKISEPFPHVLHIELSRFVIFCSSAMIELFLVVSQRPPVNAFSNEFWREYGNLFDSLTRDGYDVRAAVLSSAFPKVFTAGLERMSCLIFCCTTCTQPKFLNSTVVNLNDGPFANGGDGARVGFQTRKYLTEFQHAIGAPERAPFPVIVALHGHVIGLGVDIIGFCDIRYAASNTSFSIKVCSYACPGYFSL